MRRNSKQYEMTKTQILKQKSFEFEKLGFGICPEKYKTLVLLIFRGFSKIWSNRRFEYFRNFCLTPLSTPSLETRRSVPFRLALHPETQYQGKTQHRERHEAEFSASYFGFLKGG
jgi:hypothetical protein